MTTTGGGSFLELGYEIIQAQSSFCLRHLQNQLYLAACELLNETPAGPTASYAGLRSNTAWFDHFHERGIKGPPLNKLRLELQNRMRSQIGNTLFGSFPKIQELVGPDAVQQRGCNLVIAQPGDTEKAPTHRDAPPNSNFELVCWAPMNDCHDTKSMAILNLEQTQEALSVLSSKGYDEYVAYTLKMGTLLDVPFGAACIFWAGLVHTVPVNETNETRWSFNHRFKNFWAPYGAKGSGYFEPLTLSELTQHGLAAEAP